MMHTWTLSETDESALLLLSETVLADEYHYAGFTEDMDDRHPLFRRLYDANRDETLTLSTRDVIQVGATCCDVIRMLDNEHASRNDLAPAAYVLRQMLQFEPTLLKDDVRADFYAELAEKELPNTPMTLCATPRGTIRRIRYALKDILAHGSALDATDTSRQRAGNLRRAVDLAFWYAEVDQDDESWFMTSQNLKDLSNLFSRLKTHSTNPQFAMYHTTQVEEFIRLVTRAHITSRSNND